MEEKEGVKRKKNEIGGQGRKGERKGSKEIKEVKEGFFPSFRPSFFHTFPSITYPQVVKEKTDDAAH
jgi:hypothetical protein